MVKKEMKEFIVKMMVMIVVQAGYGTGHILYLLAPFLFSPPLLFLSAQHDSIFRTKKPPPPEEYRILIEKCQELCSEKV